MFRTAICLFSCLVFGLLVGCGSGKNENKEKNTDKEVKTDLHEKNKIIEKKIEKDVKIEIQGKEITLEVAKRFMANPRLNAFEGYTLLKDPQAAELLSKHGQIHGGKTPIAQDGTLFLDDLTTFSDEILSILVKQKGGLVLTKLKSITDSQARILASHVGTLNIYGVKNLSDAQKISLKKHNGQLLIGASLK